MSWNYDVNELFGTQTPTRLALTEVCLECGSPVDTTAKLAHVNFHNKLWQAIESIRIANQVVVVPDTSDQS